MIERDIICKIVDHEKVDGVQLFKRIRSDVREVFTLGIISALSEPYRSLDQTDGKVCLSGLRRSIVYPERLLVFFSHTEHDHKELIANRFPCLGFSEIVASVILVVIRSKMLETALGKAFFYIIFPAGADLDRTALAGSESRI